MLVLTAVFKHDILTFSLLKSVQDSDNLSRNVFFRFNFYKKAEQGMKVKINSRWSYKLLLSLSSTVLITWRLFLLFLSGDIHPNPGPVMPHSPNSSTSSSNSSLSLPDPISLCQNLSIVHYNVQSIFPKLDVLHTELIDFDILTFTET